MKKKWMVLTMIVIACLILIGTCKQNNNPIVSVDKIDRAIIQVREESGQIKEWQAQDPNFLKSLLANISFVFGNSSEDVLNFDTNLTPEEKELDYHITVYKEDKIVQTIKIFQINKITVDKEVYTINNAKQNALNNLKRQLLWVTNVVK